jgi:predicted DNA-binding protein
MSRSGSKREADTYVGFRMETEEDKRKVKMRSAQLGYDTVSAYVRDIVEQDLEDANLPLE